MVKRLMGALSVMVALLVLVPSNAWAQGTTGTIRGKVIDSSPEMTEVKYKPAIRWVSNLMISSGYPLME